MTAMPQRVLVINPNSSSAVTQAIDQAMVPLRQAGPLAIDVVDLPDGPKGIETQGHVDGVVQPLLNRIRSETAAAYVIACYSDPGLHAAREATSAPVFGIAESGILTALTLGARFGVISILRKAIPRHIRYVGAMGLMGRMAGDRAIEIGVAGLADEQRTFERMCEIGAILRDEDGADVLVMGCAGMARQRDRLADTLGIPVVEPTQAAVAMAVARIGLGW
jgi:allantoin racemase